MHLRNQSWSSITQFCTSFVYEYVYTKVNSMKYEIEFKKNILEIFFVSGMNVPKILPML